MGQHNCVRKYCAYWKVLESRACPLWQPFEILEVKRYFIFWHTNKFAQIPKSHHKVFSLWGATQQMLTVL